MSASESRVTVGIQQIAEIAGVGRSAVGNWRKRHSDFPVPDSGGTFDLGEVERWLVENGKIDRPAPAGVRIWSLVDGLRGPLAPDQVSQLLAAALVYLEVCARAQLGGDEPLTPTSVRPPDSWGALCRQSLQALAEELRRAAARIEDENPSLRDLIVPGFQYAAAANIELVASLIYDLDNAASTSAKRLELLEEGLDRAHRVNRFRGEHSTPRDVVQLMLQLAGDRDGVVCDLACGEGGLLTSAAFRLDSGVSQDARLMGFEISDVALRMARSRFLLSGLAADLRLEDAFRIPRSDLPKADLVLVDPPLGQKNWADADVYLDDRWTYGAPSPRSADLAWVQLATQCLAENGRALVLTSAPAVSRSGTDERVRRAMIQAGVVEAVIGLPGRLRADTSVRLALWVLRPPLPTATSVLLVDASKLGTTGRSQHSFDPSDIDRLVAVVHEHERGQQMDSEIAWAVDITQVIENGAILDPKRYRPEVEVNVDELRERAELVRTLLPTSATEAADAVNRFRNWTPRKGGLKWEEPNRDLEGVATVLRGSAPPGRKDSEGGVPLFGMAEIVANLLHQRRFVDRSELGSHAVRLQAGDTVVALAGDGVRSRLVTSDHEGAVLGRECAVVRPTSPELTSEWTYIWTQSSLFRDQVSRHTSGTTLPRLNFRVLQSFKIPVPPLEDQHRAAEMLQELDDSIAAVDAVSSQLEELRELRLDLFVADVRSRS